MLRERPIDGLTWNDDNLWSQFSSLLSTDAAALALVDTADRLWSRGDLGARASQAAQQLESVGIGRGDRVLLNVDRSASIVVGALAASKVGATLCCVAADIGGEAQSMIEAELGVMARLEPLPDGNIGTARGNRYRRTSDLPDEGSILIAATSGSTGRPKLVMHGAGALNYVTRACAVSGRLAPGEAILGSIPSDSAAGFTFTVHFALSLGHPLVMIDRWDPVQVMQRICDHDCRWTTMVPTQLFTMVEAAHSGAWQGRLSLRTVSVGGSAMAARLIGDAEALLGVRALRMFGMSECLAHCSNQFDDGLDRRLEWDGRPFPGTDIEAFDSMGAVCPRGLRGEAGVRGPALFLGYAAGEKRMTADGYFLTGDEIVRDEEGFVRVVGRIKDQIIRGGFNIDPAEIEAVLLTHDAIAEIVVVAIPDDKLGERACAVCRLREGYQAIDLTTIRGMMADASVYRRKWPEAVVIVEMMQTLPSGKIDRNAMAGLAIQMLGARP